MCLVVGNFILVGFGGKPKGTHTNFHVFPHGVGQTPPGPGELRERLATEREQGQQEGCGRGGLTQSHVGLSKFGTP